MNAEDRGAGRFIIFLLALSDQQAFPSSVMRGPGGVPGRGLPMQVKRAGIKRRFTECMGGLPSLTRILRWRLLIGQCLTPALGGRLLCETRGIRNSCQLHLLVRAHLRIVYPGSSLARITPPEDLLPELRAKKEDFQHIFSGNAFSARFKK